MLSQNQLPSKLLVLFDESKITHAATAYKSQLADRATVVMGTFDWFLEVLHPQVHKGHGLSRMCQELAVPLEECIAMGDGANDVEFLRMAGLGLAMKNAKEAAKKNANSIVQWTNDENGVMRALQKLETEGKLKL
jgi:hydroxymethylpyrimidine pyrophosphatase-like HAD family hydrolase